jgi:hypothetical protein
MIEDYYAHRAFITGRQVLLKRGPFRVRTVLCFTRWGAERVARKWEADDE